MGEIGLDRHDYLFNLTFTDLLMIERGYQRRCVNLWSATRWSTYHIMAAFVGDGLAKNGIHNPKDMIHLPWDDDPDNMPQPEQYTEDDIKELQADIDAANSGAIHW